LEDCRPCLIYASFTLAFALHLRKKHGKPSVRVRKTSVRVRYTYYQNTHTLQNLHTYTHTHTHAPTRPHVTKPTHTHTHKHTHTHTHTLQNNIKSPQYKLKQTQCISWRRLFFEGFTRKLQIVRYIRNVWKHLPAMCYFPEDLNLQQHHCENLKSLVVYVPFSLLRIGRGAN
jgi:hypothetical protein